MLLLSSERWKKHTLSPMHYCFYYTSFYFREQLCYEFVKLKIENTLDALFIMLPVGKYLFEVSRDLTNNGECLEKLRSLAEKNQLLASKTGTASAKKRL